MKFDKLNETIPYAVGGKEKTLTYSPYPFITLAMPGRHQKETDPVGGDFVVMIEDLVWDMRLHQFTHTDIFKDVEEKSKHDDISFFMNAYANIVIAGDDPLKYSPGDVQDMPGIIFSTFLCAAQCLALAEHRRYAKFEAKFGGRYLPLRFAAGIVEGKWTAIDAIEKQRMGRPGVEWLEKEKGLPNLTEELMK